MQVDETAICWGAIKTCHSSLSDYFLGITRLRVFIEEIRKISLKLPLIVQEKHFLTFSKGLLYKNLK